MTGGNYLVIDIETADLEFEDSAISDYLADKEIVPALHPYFSRLSCIGVKRANEEPVIIHGEDEARILEQFWGIVRRAGAPLIVTFNGYRFDIPYINIRSVMCGIRPDPSINLNKWTMGRSNHFDIMQALSSTGNFAWVGLEMTARVFGVPVPGDTIPSEDMPGLFHEGNWEAIIKHNTHDLIMTEGIYLKIKDLF